MSSATDDVSRELSLQVGESRTILLLAPGFADHENSTCIDLLTVTEPTQENVLSFACTHSPTDRIQIWQSEMDDLLPSQATIVSVGDQSQSSSATELPANQADTISIETVGSAGDLTKLGITLTTQLDRWADNDNQTVLCFHSLTTVLQYTDLETTFQFLNTMLTRLRTADVIAHFHLNPAAHDEQTVHTLGQLFDTIIEIDENGDKTIKQKLVG